VFSTEYMRRMKRFGRAGPDGPDDVELELTDGVSGQVRKLTCYFPSPELLKSAQLTSGDVW